MIKEIAKNTYQNLMPSGDTVEIGDKDSLDFKPHLKLNRFGGECFIKVGLPVTEKSLPIIDGDRITWEGRGRHIIMYPLAPDKQMELGGYEYEIVLDKKPRSNKIILDIQSQGLKFFYQPPLHPDHPTWYEGEDGYSYRPENIVGSYAVYHATKGGMVTLQDVARGITTGQGLIIFRPRIVNAIGQWMWEEQYIDPVTGKQIITIPQEMIEGGHYPLRHVAGDTFGYTTKGGSTKDIDTFRYYNEHQLTAGSGTADSITWYIYRSGPVGENLKVGLYNDSEARIATCSPQSFPSNQDDWLTVALSTNPDLTQNEYYWLGGRTDGAGGSVKCYYNTNSIYYGYHSADYASFPPADFTDVTKTTGRLFSVYCTYTPAVPPPTFIPRVVMF